ncbi:MAG TPA: peptidylprolyl isomerase, partial [Cytophagaceae bacterium]
MKENTNTYCKNRSAAKFSLLASILLVLVFSANGAYAQVVDKIIGKVDNEIILKSELEVLYLQYLSNNASASPEDLKCKVLESLLVNKLLVAKAEIDSVVVEKTQVDEQLDRRMAYFVQQVGSEQKLEEYYGKTVDALKQDLRKQVKEQLVIQKMQDLITGKVKVTPSEIKKYFNS